jgi:hypothetical protein
VRVGAILLAACTAACAGTSRAGGAAPAPTAEATAAVNAVLDDWHDAASKAEEARYFGHFAPPNMGPCRGSGVLVREAGAWKIAHYNLALTVPNAKLRAVREVLQ